MNRAFIVPFIRAFLFLLTCPVYAATLYVDASVSQSGDGQTWEAALRTIQEGIDASSEGDTVLVGEGVYVESIEFKGKNVVLTSTKPTDPAVVANTVIDASQNGPVVNFGGAETTACVLSGFTIRNGIGGICGGVVENASRAKIEHNTITDNLGAGLWYCDGLIRENTISRNSDRGLYDCDGMIEENVISENSTTGDGGGLCDCPGTILKNIIAGNTGRSGGGLAFCQAIIENNTIRDNRASGEGGGLFCCDRIIRMNEILGNAGGGLYDCDGTIDNNVIAANSGYGGGGLAECDGTIQSNVISSNFASKYGGGLAHCDGAMQENIISANLTDRIGGGLYDCNGSIQGNTIHANRARVSGGAFYDCAGAIVNCIIWDNSAGDNTHLFLTTEPSYSCIQEWTLGGEGNIGEDPRFVDPDGPDNDPDTYEDNDYRLLPDSPCIDTGFNHLDLPAKDIAGTRRVMYGGKSLTVDMGAYEYYINEVHTGPGPSETTLTWSSIAGSTYVILYSEDLLIWILAQAGVPSAGNQTTSWTDDGTFTVVPPCLAPRRFYRVLENP